MHTLELRAHTRFTSGRTTSISLTFLHVHIPFPYVMLLFPFCVPFHLPCSCQHIPAPCIILPFSLDRPPSSIFASALQCFGGVLLLCFACLSSSSISLISLTYSSLLLASSSSCFPICVVWAEVSLCEQTLVCPIFCESKILFVTQHMFRGPLSLQSPVCCVCSYPCSNVATLQRAFPKSLSCSCCRCICVETFITYAPHTQKIFFNTLTCVLHPSFCTTHTFLWWLVPSLCVAKQSLCAYLKCSCLRVFTLCCTHSPFLLSYCIMMPRCCLL